MPRLFQPTPNQLRMWAGDSLHSTEPVYNEVVAFSIRGTVDAENFCRAFLAVAAGTDALRMVLVEVDGEPKLRVADEPPAPPDVVDLRGESDPSAAYDAWIRAHRATRFELSRRAYHTALIRIGEDHTVWYLALHHILTDGVSVEKLFHRVADCYGRMVAGTLDDMPEFPRFADYLEYFEEYRGTRRYAKAKAYWKEKLEEPCPPVTFFDGKAHDPWRSTAKERVRVELGQELSQGIRERALSEELRGGSDSFSLFSAFCGMLAIYVHRLTGHRRVAIGSPFHNRTKAFSDVIGLFMEQAPLHVEIEKGETLASVVRQVQSEIRATVRHLPFATGNPGRSYFQVGANFLTISVPEFAGMPVVAHWLHSGFGEDIFALHVHDVDESGCLVVELDFNKELFSEAQRSRVREHMFRLLEAFRDDPWQPLSEVDLLSQQERVSLSTWNRTEADHPLDTPLHRLVERQVARSPEAVAVRFRDETVSYQELEARANRLAHELIALGVGPETRVGVCMERSVELVVSLLAVLKAGGAYVPLDPDYPRARLQAMLEDASPTAILVQERLGEALPPTDVKLIVLEDEWPRIIAERSPDAPMVDVAPMDAAYVIFTSGSTGRPKGVVNEHRGIVNRLCWMQEAFELDRSDRVMQKTPYSFDVSVWEFFWPLLAGAGIVVAEPGGHRDPTYLARTIKRERVTTIHFVPSMLRAFVESDGFGGCASLRRMVCSGEALAPDLAETVLERLPTTELYNLYGPTEAAVDVTWWRCVPGWSETSVPIGSPVANTRIHVLDGYGQETPVGVPGELHIGGVQVARGYLGRPELTAERFVPDPFADHPEARLYRTGDLAFWREDGSLEFLGRLDHQVKIRGFRIEMGEIEARLREHPGVVECAVAAGPRKGDGEPRLVGYVVMDGGARADPGELREHLALTLPAHMIPTAIVQLESLPSTPSGKLDRKALPEPEGITPGMEPTHEGPRRGAEERIAAVWRDVLGVEVGRQDNFFELGGDSIQLIRTVARLRKVGIVVTPKQAFLDPTVAGLGRVAEAGGAARTLAETGPEGEVALTPIQRWFFTPPPAEVNHWNQAQLFEVRQDFAPDLIQTALNAVVSHHDSLRLRFEREGAGKWRQRYGEPRRVVLERHELGRTKPEARPEAIEAIGRSLQRSLDVGEGRLVAAAHIDMGPEEPPRLAVVIHHLAVDAVSWPILLEDLEDACLGLRSGEEPTFPAKTTSFGQWAGRLQRFAASEALQEERGVWEEVERLRRPLLPIDGPGGDNSEASGASLITELERSLTERLLTTAGREHGARGNEILLSGLALALIPDGESRPVVVDVEGHGRESLWDEVDLSRTTGWFTTLTPVPLEIPADRDPAGTLRAVKERIRSLPNNGLGYGVLRHLTSTLTTDLDVEVGTQVTFNFLGPVDRPDTALLRPVQSGLGPSYGPGGMRRFGLEIVAWIEEGRLRVSWNHSRNLHHARTIRALADRFTRALETLASELARPESRARTLAPSDFPLARLDPEELARITESAPELEDLYPLASLQQGLLFESLRTGGTGAYHLQTWITVEGPLDPARLREAWERVVERHTVLRTGFVWDRLAEPLQAVHRRVELPWTVEDSGRQTEAEVEDRMEELLDRDRQRGFDLRHPPLGRVAVVRTGPTRWQVVWSAHHLILDGWSGNRMMGEVFAVYGALVSGGEPHLPEARPYREFVSFLAKTSTAEDEAFWRERLAGFREPVALDVDRGAAHGGREFRDETVVLTGKATGAIEAFARSRRLTLNTVVQGALAILLHRYSGRDDVVFGFSMTTRPPGLEAAEDRIGLFINTLPVRILLPDGVPVGRWLDELQRRQAESREHEHASLAKVKRWSEVPPASPLFETLLVFENYPSNDMMAPVRPALEPVGIRFFENTHYPLTLMAVPGSRLGFRAGFDSGRFDRDTVRRMLEHLARTLERMIDSPEVPVRDLPLADDSFRREVVEGRAGVVDPGLAQGSFLEWVRREVDRRPDAAAVEDDQGRSWSYETLWEASTKVVSALAELDVERGSRVGVHLSRGAPMVAILLGVLRSGAAYLPLDPTFPTERLRHMVDDGGVTLIVTDPPGAGNDSRPETFSPIPSVTSDALLAAPPAGSRCGTPEAPGSDDLAYVIYTSGSTGLPKGVEIHHGALRNLLGAMAREPGLTEDDALLAVTTLSFDISALELFLPLCVGARMIIPDADVTRDGRELRRRLEGSGATVMQATPAGWRMLLDAGWDGRLKRALCGGEALPAALAGELVDHADQVWNLYGPTETTIWSTVGRVTTDGPVTVGRPIANTRVYILDAVGNLVPDGVSGEIWIAGAGVARGYHARPELTGDRFRPDAFVEGERMYRTGDLGRWRADGRIEHLGRMDLQVKVRGFRIEPGEIEAALERLDSIRQAVVVARGEAENRRLDAYVVPEDGAATETHEIRDRLRASLPDYMVPGLILPVDRMPLSPNGKVDRSALPDPRESRIGPAPSYDPPKGKIESAVAEIWQELLPEVARVGRHDNFFELGGHSLLAMRVVAELEKRHGISLAAPELFYRSVSQIAASATREPELAGSTAGAEPSAGAPSSVTVADQGRWRRIPGSLMRWFGVLS